jgi:hypothetical protein
MASHLRDSLLSNAQAVAQQATAYSNSVDFRNCVGDAILLIASTAGSITVTQQCSFDGVTFYSPETAAGAAGAVEDTITVTTGRYLSFSPILCAYIRFKIVEGNTASTSVTLRLLQRVEG